MAGNRQISLCEPYISAPLYMNTNKLYSNEHYNRAPDCAFFTLVNSTQPTTKKSSKAKGARSSKASRLSIQSVATMASDTQSVTDLPAHPDDSVLTTASVMTQGGRKTTKGRKAATTKGAKKKGKKGDVDLLTSDPLQQDVDMPPPPPPKPTRGKKRGSDAVDDSVLSTATAPPAKKRATRTRGSQAQDSSVLMPSSQADTSAVSVEPPKAAKGKRARASSKSTRKASTVSTISTASTASLRVAPGHFPSDDELERQLQADLDRPLSDDEEIAADSDSERKRAPGTNARGKGAAAASAPQLDYAMFDPSPAVVDEMAIEDELKALENEMDVDQEEAPIAVPKKGRKAGGTTRKASKQTKSKKTQQATETVKEAPAATAPTPAQEHDMGHEEQPQEHLDSRLSTGTVVKAPTPPRLIVGKKKVSQSKKSTASRAEEDELANADEAESVGSVEVEKKAVRRDTAKARGPSQRNMEVEQSPNTVDILAAPSSIARPLPAPPSTPGTLISPAQSARQAVISPSQSPQSSDAENQPPSSRPSRSTKRIALAPVASTPMKMSPSKRNVIAGLQSSTTWTAVDLEMIFGSGGAMGGKENELEGFIVQGTDLSTPEKRMTVEEWIYHNAGQAEQKLKYECEAMVSKLESEGTRAMTVLEGLIVE
jgi:hypothetical protein